MEQRHQQLHHRVVAEVDLDIVDGQCTACRARDAGNSQRVGAGLELRVKLAVPTSTSRLVKIHTGEFLA